MFNRITLAIVVTVFVTAQSQAQESTFQLDMLCDHAQPMRVQAATSDKAFEVGMNVPAYAKAVVIAHVSPLSKLDDKLYEAIVNNSAEDVRQAVINGASITKLKEGRTPLAWALLFGRTNAAAALLSLGAR